MATKVSNDNIKEFCKLYREFGTYSAVAKATGFSASTVSKYVKEYLNSSMCAQAEPLFLNITLDDIDADGREVRELFFKNYNDFSPLCKLTEEEEIEIQKALRGEQK